MSGHTACMSPVTTRTEALAGGVTISRLRHLLARGSWQRVFDGVFVTHGGPLTYRERLEAATRARGPGAVVSLECALHLWGLTDRQPPVITLAEPAGTHRTRALPGVRARRRRRLTTARRYGIPVTALPQTLLDVAATMDADAIIALLTRAVAGRRVTVGQLREELAHHPRHPRRLLLEQVLTAADEGLESVAEVRYARDVERAHGLPRMQRQAALDGGERGRSRRLDFRDAERGLGVEIDGEIFHRDRAHLDRGRDREAAGRGDIILRAGWFEVVERPCQLAADVAAALLARGWTGSSTPCSPACAIRRDQRLRKAS